MDELLLQLPKSQYKDSIKNIKSLLKANTNDIEKYRKFLDAKEKIVTTPAEQKAAIKT